MWAYCFSFFLCIFIIFEIILHITYSSVQTMQKYLKFLCNITRDYFPMILGSLNKNNLPSQKYVHFAFWNILTTLFLETLYQFPFPLAVFESLLSPYFYLSSTPFLIIFILFFYCSLICFLIETIILNSIIFQPTTYLKFNLSWFPRIFFF